MAKPALLLSLFSRLEACLFSCALALPIPPLLARLAFCPPLQTPELLREFAVAAADRVAQTTTQHSPFAANSSQKLLKFLASFKPFSLHHIFVRSHVRVLVHTSNLQNLCVVFLF
jgi:hypothetical protein